MTTSLVPGTAEWARLITASKVAAILGLSPYDSPLSTWHKMKGNVPLEQETEDHRRGHFAEPAVLAWWRAEHPEFTRIRRHPQWQRRDLPWAAATPDAAAYGPSVDRASVEVKTARNLDEWGDPGTDQIPAYYWVQTQFQMHLSGMRRTFVPVWGSWFEMAEYVVDYDADLAEGIVTKCADFWASLEADEPPPLDNTVATLTVLKQLHPNISDGVTVQLDADVSAEFIDAANAFKEAEARKRAAQSAVLAAMGAAQYGHHGDVRVARRQPARGDAVALYQVAKSVAAITELGAAS